MSTPNEKLAESLDELKALQQGNRRVFRSDDLSRVHRERLVENGFLQEVMKGWLISSSPDAHAGESTPWHASFWEFCARYCDERFGDQWHLSPEQSLFLHGERTVIPDQLVVHSPRATNNDIQLLFGTTLYDLKTAEMPPPAALTVRDGLRLFTPAAALVRVPESFFQMYPLEAQVVMASLADASDLLRLLLNGGHSAKAGYLAKAFRQTGRPELADEILRAMKGAGYDVRESSPFEAGQIVRRPSRSAASIVSRVEMLWESMRGKVLVSFPKPPGLPADKEAYLRFVDEIYRTDAYHSLSIEGYSVTPALVDRVRQGGWDPEHDAGDRRNRDALAARGYWQAFQLVKKEVEKVTAGENPAALARTSHNNWYRELFQPCVTAGLLEPGALAGYRNVPVFLRGSRYIPPRWEAVRDAMPAFFDVLEKEPEPSVRAVLGHWLFGYVHPYPDGNGRMARFLMNVMLASGGYPWTVIRVVDRKAYLSALDRASIEMDIHPFTSFIVRRVQWRLEPHDVTFPAPKESVALGRDMVFFYGKDGEAVVRCAITGEALDHHFQGDGKDRLKVFRANRQPIEQEVRRRYLAGDTELDGSILIRSGDLPDDSSSQKTDPHSAELPDDLSSQKADAHLGDLPDDLPSQKTDPHLGDLPDDSFSQNTDPHPGDLPDDSFSQNTDPHSGDLPDDLPSQKTDPHSGDPSDDWSSQKTDPHPGDLPDDSSSQRTNSPLGDLPDASSFQNTDPHSGDPPDDWSSQKTDPHPGDLPHDLPSQKTDPRPADLPDDSSSQETKSSASSA